MKGIEFQLFFFPDLYKHGSRNILFQFLVDSCGCIPSLNGSFVNCKRPTKRPRKRPTMSKRKRSDNGPRANDYLPVGLLRGLREQQSTGTFCDVVLKGSEESALGIPCHRALLSAHSAYFRAAFSENWKDSKQHVFQLYNIDSRTLNELVKYFYTLDINLNNDNVEEILIAAQFLQLDSLAKRCWRYVVEHMCLSDSLAVHALASQHHNCVLAEKALGYIRRRFPQFAQSQDFLQMDAQQLIELLVSDEVDVGSEDQVLQAVLRWLDHDRPGRVAHASTILQGVRAAFLSEQCRQEYTLARDSVPAVASACQSALTSALSDATTKPTPRYSYDARDVILCVGGCGREDAACVRATVDVFCPSLAAVWRLQPLPTNVGCCGAMMLSAGALLITRFDHTVTVQRDSHYTDLQYKWSRGAGMQTLRRSEGLAALQGRLYAAGGYGLGGRAIQPLLSVESYDPPSDAWSAVAALPVGLAQPAMVECNGRLYAFGGEREGRNPCSSAFVYDPAANVWSRLADMPTARRRCVDCVAPSGLIYVIGGEFGDARDTGRCVEAYNPVTNQWFTKRDLIMGRSNPGCVCLDGKLYVLGGYADEDGDDCLDSIEVYDEATDRWALHECRLPQGKFGFGCVVMKLRRA